MSLCSRLVMDGHHPTDGKWSLGKESIDSVTKTEANEPSRLSSGEFFSTFPAYVAGPLTRCNPKLWVKQKLVKSFFIMF